MSAEMTPSLEDLAAAFEEDAAQVLAMASPGLRLDPMDPNVEITEDLIDDVLNQMLAAKNEMERIQESADARIKRVGNRIKYLMFRFGGVIEWYTRQKLAEEVGKRARKSITLPCGAVMRVRSKAAHLKIVDEDTLLAFLEMGAPLTVRVKKEVDKKALTALWVELGEPPLGTEVIEASERFEIDGLMKAVGSDD